MNTVHVTLDKLFMWSLGCGFTPSSHDLTPCEDHTRGCDVTHHTKSQPKSVISQVCAICDAYAPVVLALFAKLAEAMDAIE